MIKKLFYFLYFRYLISQLWRDFKHCNPMKYANLFGYYSLKLDNVAFEGGFWKDYQTSQLKTKLDNLTIWIENQIAERKVQQQN